MKTKQIIIFIIVISIFSCGFLGTKIKLTDSHITGYIKVCRTLSRNSPAMLAMLQAQQNVSEEDAKSQFNNIESVIKDAGFTDYEEFMNVSMEIAKCMSLVSSQNFMTKINNLDEKIEQDVMNQINESMADDPELRAAFEQALKEEMANIREETADENAKNNEIANMILNELKKVTDSDNADVISRHIDELENMWIP